jgi:hypothetical protein
MSSKSNYRESTLMSGEWVRVHKRLPRGGRDYKATAVVALANFQSQQLWGI